ncbi:hypothetical protein B9G53_12265 [Pseudanabaena sp. SR411]|uniref:hypothetical protein n=1 Tax=Pseudanabaena sp. SR411 TaxID=1980935 RepID=UPI000B98B89C|nr:hypothetical protein [Pseudanabaena sp. SR411]OYQ64309.1 hypothetical protein B9G53_12265 [Pseudanabaena sp. SR411]
MKNINLFYQCHVSGQDSTIWQLQCHLRIIYHQFGQQIVIVSPQNCEVGWFIPSQIEKLATQIIRDFQLNPNRLTWIEHDPNYASRQICSEYSEVTFQWKQAIIATNPHWQAISNELVDSLIADTDYSDSWSKIHLFTNPLQLLPHNSYLRETKDYLPALSA